MSDRVLVAMPNGQWLALSPDVFREALVAGAEAAGIADAVKNDQTSDEELLDAETLGTQLALPPSWLSQAAREQKIPHVRAGRWIRFSRRAVERALANGAGRQR